MSTLTAALQKIGTASLLAGALFVAPDVTLASDYCKTANTRFNFSTPPSVYRYGFVVKSGEKCTKRYTFGGTMIFKNLAYQVDARFGRVDIFPNGTAVYTARRGYRGPDSFTLRLCGASNGRDGCADLEYSVTVE